MANADGLRRLVRNRAAGIARAAGPIARQRVAEATNRRTGRLAEGWTWESFAEGNVFGVRLANRTEQPRPAWIDQGTPPHEIQGRPLLVFYWPKAGRVVFLRRVQHPGYGGSRFVDRTLRDAGWWRGVLADAERVA